MKYPITLRNRQQKTLVMPTKNGLIVWTGKSLLRDEKPRFKSRKNSKPAFYNENINLKVKPKTVLSEKIGWERTSE